MTTFPNYLDWIRFYGTFETDTDKKVSEVEFQIVTDDVVSSKQGIDRSPIFFTDIQFQAGQQLTGWNPNTREFMEKLTWTNDENEYVALPARFEGKPPKVWENLDVRWFNVVGRGHETYVIPNYYIENFNIPILSTGMDVLIYPKDDFDLLRVSTNYGVPLPEDKQFYKQQGGIYHEIKRKYEQVSRMDPNAPGADVERIKREISNWEDIIQPLLDNHPLHTRYTREFWVDGAKADSEIRIDATTRTATINGKDIPIVGQHSLDVEGVEFPIDRKKFMVAPKGTATIRFEFYKKVDKTIITYDMDSDFKYRKVKKTFSVLEDVGIGYRGTVGFNQWTEGLSKV